ncbi:Pesticin receptor, partial [termite gut metagenome]
MNLLAILFIVPFQAAQPADTAKIYEIPTVTVHAPLKHNGVFSEQPVAVTSLTMENMEFNRIGEPKNLSLTVPNLLFADYGSKMTGSIYIRGIGARMDQPAMGLYVDNIPVLNKNNYDFDYFDVRSMDVLRGPQGTLYGRNTIGGVIEVHTLSPFDYQGTRINAEYGNGNTSKARISTYHRPADDFAFSIALNHHYNDGFFTNEYDDSPADRILSESGRLKIQAKLSPQWIMENVFYANYVKQKGFAYSLYEEDTDHSINHNDPCSYDRFNLTNGLTFRYKDDKIRFSSTTSFQYTDDDMTLDQDFRPVSMFTLRQRQQENAMTQEVILRPTEEKAWQWISGAFGFYRNIELDAPVT